MMNLVISKWMIKKYKSSALSIPFVINIQKNKNKRNCTKIVPLEFWYPTLPTLLFCPKSCFSVLTIRKMKIPSIVRLLTALPFSRQTTPFLAKSKTFLDAPRRPFSTASAEGQEMKEFMEYLEKLKNYEKIGVPKGAGTDSDDGFDLGRMRRLLHNLGNPQSQFKVIFFFLLSLFFKQFG